MNNELIKKTTKILGGSAVAGLGLSFGRDVYKKTKNDKDGILILLVLIAAAVGIYVSGLIFGRNHRSLAGGIFSRIGAVLILIPSLAIMAPIASNFTTDITEPLSTHKIGPVFIYDEDLDNKAEFEKEKAAWEERKAASVEAQEKWDIEESARKEGRKISNKFLSKIGLKDKPDESIMANTAPRPVFEETEPEYTPLGLEGVPAPSGMIDKNKDGTFVITRDLFLGIKYSMSLFAIGFVIGVMQRIKRAKLFRIEKLNQQFLVDHDLEEDEDENLVCKKTDQVFRVDDMSPQKITLFPKGTRGKRAFIHVDKTGKYTEFSGVVKI